MNGAFGSVFRLPPRSAVWSPLVTATDGSSMFSSVDGLFPSNSILPNLREAISIITPLLLSENESAKISPKKRKAWTKIERATASRATTVNSIEHLTQLVECTSSLLYNMLMLSLYASSKRLMRAVYAKKTVTSKCLILY